MAARTFDYYVGLDVSQRKTAICVINSFGDIIHETSVSSDPQSLHKWLEKRIVNAGSQSIRVGLEAGSLSHWLQSGLCQLGYEVVCLETFQAHRFLTTFRNKTDKNDARGLAQLLRMGGEQYLRIVQLKSQKSQETRTLLSNRNHLVKFKVSLENHISGSLKPYGAVVQRTNCKPEIFRKRIIQAIYELEQRNIYLEQIFAPTLSVHEQIIAQIDFLTQQTKTLADEISIVKNFMEIPGVGSITALSFYCAVDQPERFQKSTDVAAYFGLTPKQFQSGDTDYNVGISKRGDASVRRALVISATVLLTSTKKWCSLKAWGIRLASRVGMSKARIAVARKLAIIMHRMWLNDEKWRPVQIPALEEASLTKYLNRKKTKSQNHDKANNHIINEDGEIIL